MKWHFLLSVLLVFAVSCTQSDGQKIKKIRIGFSQCTTNDEWRRTMNEEMMREISLYKDYQIDLMIKDAKDDNDAQIRHIREFLNTGIDILIVSPNEAEPLTPIVEEVFDKGIPVILIDRKIHSEKFTAYVGANNLLVGKEAGRMAAELLKGKGRILEITGLDGSTPKIERSKGFNDILEGYPEITIVKSIEGKWQQEIAQHIADTLFNNFKDFDLIFAHNDPMAYGAYRAASKHGIKPLIIGIDGLNIAKGGVTMVMNGYLNGTILYPTGSDKAVQLAVNILKGEPFNRFNTLNTVKIYQDNARILSLQREQILGQHAKIDLQRQYIGEMTFLLQRQRNFLLLLVFTVALLLLLIGMTIYFLNKKNQINKIMGIKNSTIEKQYRQIAQQRDDVVKALKIAEEATEMKLNFFTNISHEFRTSLSLISLPLNDLVENSKDDAFRKKLLNIQDNTDRLIRLSEEIMDFRKIDKHKYQLNAVKSDLGQFIIEKIESFRLQAQEKNIMLKYFVPAHLEVEFDHEILEKVMFNLLSNAIKYTQQGGEIVVKVEPGHSKVNISVADNGIGIPEDQIPYIFDLFYRVKSGSLQAGENGLGIGLSLCKELIHLHNGKITAKSHTKGGTVFTITLPQFQHGFMPETKQLKPVDRKIVIDADKTKEVLIVEDNPELLNVLAEMVGKYYRVITASDGKTGLEMAIKHIPSLIISDIFMPVMDGIELCQEIKKNHQTFHIPVILLTAIDSQESKISSFNIGADDYLTKPFNENILLTRAKNLIESRKNLKKSLGKYQFFFNEIKNLNHADQEFINQCVEIIQQNISDEDFKLDQLADMMNMSRSSLYRKIKKVTNSKAVDFMKKARLQYAAKLLLNEDLTVSEVAYQCGFSDVKYFSKCFSQEFDHNPSKFKNAILSSKDINEFM